MRYSDIYDAVAYEPHVEPNTNHMMLARLVATGKVRTIVTTNFDQLIEKALDQQGMQPGQDCDVIYREEDFERIDWAQDRCRLIKIHGSIDDTQAMAITLSQVAKQELSAARAGIVRHVFSRGDHKQVLILGYSCSDVFDLSPQIEALTDSLKKVCLVQHSGSPKIEDIREQERKNPFKAFDNSTRLFLNTGNLVEALWKATLKEPYQDHKALKTTPDWKAKVQAWYIDSLQTHSEAIKDGIPGQIFHAICEWRAAIGRYEHVLAYARGHAHDQLEEFALSNMGDAYRDLGEYRKAIGLYEQALEIARRIGDVQGEGVILTNMGSACVQLGEHRKAIGFHEQALDIARRIGDLRGEGAALGSMGIAYANLGEYSKAIGFLEQALEMARRIGDLRGEGTDLANMGSAYLQVGEYRKAIGFLEQALDIARRIGDLRGEGTALTNMGSACVQLGEYSKAIGLKEQALDIARRIGDLRGEDAALGSTGNAYLQLGEYRKAIGFYEQALEIERRIGNAQDEGSTLGNMGIAYGNLGEYRKAVGFLEEALEAHRRIGDLRAEGLDLGSIGLAYASIGGKAKAAQTFAQSKAILARLELPHMVSGIDKIMKQVGL